MKNTTICIVLLNKLTTLIFLFTIILFGCKEDYKSPTVITSNAESITYTSAIIGGEVIIEGDGPITSIGLKFSQDFDSSYTQIIELDTIQKKFTYKVTHLSPNTIYYVQAYASNEYGTESGEIKQFTTKAKINTLKISDITKTTATCGLSCKELGNAEIIYGICWSQSTNPTIYNSYFVYENIATSIRIKMTGLIPDTKYYVRAFAINSTDTSYGEIRSFKTYSQDAISDIDGNCYNSVTIGSQIWLQEDLQVTHFNNGEPINTTQNEVYDLRTEIAPNYYWPYDQRIDSNIFKNSKAYTWYAVSDLRGVCPEGWRAPDFLDWKNLSLFLGGDNIAGSKLKLISDYLWSNLSENTTNESGFSAIPGLRICNRQIFYGGDYTYYWSVSEVDNEFAYSIQLESWNDYMFFQSHLKFFGLPCRCIKE